MKQFSTLLLVILSASVSAQTWFEVGTTWTYNHQEAFDWNQEEYLAEFQVTEMVEHNGRACSKIESTLGGLPCLSVQPPYYMYESNDSIFYSSESMDDFELALVFNETDSWMFTITNEIYTESYQVSVLNSQIENIGGADLRVLTLDYLNTGEGINEIFPSEIEVIEYVGGLSYFMVPFGNAGTCDGAYNIRLRCFSSPSFNYQNPEFSSCTLSSADVEYLETGLVYPNPARQTISWNEPFEELLVFDITGKLVLHDRQVISKSTLSVSDLEAGIYMIRLKREGSFFSQKLIINH